MAFQLAGYPQVVDTLGEIDDALADCIDGTPMVPGGDEHRIGFGIVSRLPAGVSAKPRTVCLLPRWQGDWPVRAGRLVIVLCRFGDSQPCLVFRHPEPQPLWWDPQYPGPVLQRIQVLGLPGTARSARTRVACKR